MRTSHLKHFKVSFTSKNANLMLPCMPLLFLICVFTTGKKSFSSQILSFLMLLVPNGLGDFPQSLILYFILWRHCTPHLACFSEWVEIWVRESIWVWFLSEGGHRRLMAFGNISRFPWIKMKQKHPKQVAIYAFTIKMWMLRTTESSQMVIIFFSQLQSLCLPFEM